MQNLFVLSDAPDFTPHISRLVDMMNYARHTTLEAVKMLNQQELDNLPDPKGNSIGMLLAHMAAVEEYYQMFSFLGREPNEQEEKPLLAALDLGERGRQELRGQPIKHYLNNLKTVRAKTLKEFAKRNDEWLHQEFPFWGETGNNYFCWFHVFEDEINHRGQIRLLIKDLPRFQNPGYLGMRLAAATENGFGLRLLDVTTGGAASDAGLKTNDLVLSVDGEDVTQKLFEEISLYGPAGTVAHFVVQRGAVAEPLKINVVRRGRG